MDLIFTNASKVDQGVLSAYDFDLSFGEKENDFEMTLGADEPALEYGAFAYIEGTEYGGIVDTMKTSTDGDTVTYKGRTWHGMLNSKVIQPDSGANYLVMSGDANRILERLIAYLGIGNPLGWKRIVFDGTEPWTFVSNTWFQLSKTYYPAISDIPPLGGKRICNYYASSSASTWNGMSDKEIATNGSYLRIKDSAFTTLDAWTAHLAELYAVGEPLTLEYQSTDAAAASEGLFVAEDVDSGITIKNYQFHRYCKGYDGIRAMLAAHDAKLKIVWKNRAVHLSAEPIVDYTEAPIDGDVAKLNVEHCDNKVNHLICLGRGDLAKREVIHLYADAFGQISDTQYYTGIHENTEVFEYSNAESSAELRKSGIKELKELRDIDTAEIDVPENDELAFDIGDIVGASDAAKTKISVASAVTQKIVRINNGAISTEYQTGS